MSLNAWRGTRPSACGWSPWDPLPAPKIHQKSNRHSIEETLPKRWLPDPHMEPEGYPEGLQIQPKPCKLRPGAGLGRASGKKHAKVRSVQYLPWSTHIQALSRTSLLINFSVPNSSSFFVLLSGWSLKINLQNDTTFVPNLSEKHPDGPQDNRKTHLKSTCFPFRSFSSPTSAPQGAWME